MVLIFWIWDFVSALRKVDREKWGRIPTKRGGAVVAEEIAEVVLIDPLPSSRRFVRY
jgi:hypothetical protein